MANGRKHLTIEADGEVYNLRVSYNALCDVIDKMGPVDLKTITLPVARAIVWAGVNNYGTKTITLQKAGDICEAIIREKGIPGLQDTLKHLIDESDWLKDKKEDEKGADTGNAETLTPAASES